MRWCQKHWDSLREEVKKQGLAPLVSDSGEEVMTKMARQVEGEEGIDTFDPLMNAHWAINSFIGGSMGPGGVVAVIALDGCPICKVDEIHMANCLDPRHDKPCTTSIDWCFESAVAEQKAAWEAMRP